MLSWLFPKFLSFRLISSYRILFHLNPFDPNDLFTFFAIAATTAALRLNVLAFVAIFLDESSALFLRLRMLGLLVNERLIIVLWQLWLTHNE
jgi:hypothetical protein